MSAAPSQPLALPPLMPDPPPVMPMEEHAFELLAALLTTLGAVDCAALVAVGSARLLTLWKTRMVDELWRLTAAGALRFRAAELTMRTIALVTAGEYAAAVDALEAHAVTGCEDCWEGALDARAYVLCDGCRQRLEVDALPVVDDELVVDAEALTEPAPFDVMTLLDPNGATLDEEPGPESRPGPARCETTAADRFYACLAVVTLPGQAVTLWREMEGELTATERAAARIALNEHVGRVGRMQRPAQWIDRALMEPAARGAR